MKNTAKFQIITFFKSIACYLLIIILLQTNEPIYEYVQFAIGLFMAMFGLTYITLTRAKDINPLNIIFAIWIGMSIIELPLIMVCRSQPIIALIVYLYWCLGIANGYLFWRLKTDKWRVILASLGILIIATIPTAISFCFGLLPN